MNKYFVVLAGSNVQVRVSSSVERMYAQIAEALREEDVHGLAIPMATSRLAQGVWVQFQISGVGEFTCSEELSVHNWDIGPTGEWKMKVTLARYGAWGDDNAIHALLEGVRAEFGGDFSEWEVYEEEWIHDLGNDFE